MSQKSQASFDNAKGGNLARGAAGQQISQQGANNPEEKLSGSPDNQSSSVPEGSITGSTKGKKKVARKKSVAESTKTMNKGKTYFKLDQIGFKIRLNCELRLRMFKATILRISSIYRYD